MVEAGFYHEFQSEVEDSETPGIIKPQVHWNAKHKPVKLLGYELVDQDKDFVNQSYIEFTGLDGNVDLEYLLEYDITTDTPSKDPYLILNAANTDITALYQLANTGLANVNCGSGGLTSMQLAYTADGNLTFCVGEATIFAKSGRKRYVKNKSHFVNTKKHMEEHLHEWTDTSANITSLRVAIPSAGTMSGTIRLWKKLPLNE